MVIGYLTCDYSFTVFGGRVVNKGPSVLLLRRGFNVSAMVGQWSINAGVDDIVDDRFDEEKRRELRAFDEIVGETGISPSMITGITRIGQRDQPNADKPGQVFKQTLFWAEAKRIDRVALCYEHTGYVWIPMAMIEEAVKNRISLDKELCQVMRDGVVPGFWEGMEVLCSAFRQRYPQ